MDTADRSPDWYLGRAAETVPGDFVAPEQGDWGRLSRDAFIASTDVSARAVRSEGDLRLSGLGVEMNSADLSAVGSIATAWQKVVSAAGAALEDVRSLRGSLPAGVVQRTALVLNASPQPGSVVLHLEPKASPLPEVEPDGDVPIVQPARPLADRASEEVIQLLAHASRADLAETDALSEEFLRLGPRVGGGLSTLAQTLDRASITLDANWAEPSTPSVRASVSPAAARWIVQFVAGRGLDAEEQYIVGVLHTVSDRERWLVGVGDEALPMDASELAPSVAETWHVNERVMLTVRVAETVRPDGTRRTSRTILSVASAEQPPTPDR